MLGGPLVEQHDRPLFQKADDQCQPPALTAGQVEGTKLAVGQRGLVGEAVLRQQPPDFGRIGVRYAVQPLEQMIIEKNRRH